MRLVTSILAIAWHPRTTKVTIPAQARIADPLLDHHVPLQEARRAQRPDQPARAQEGHHALTRAARLAQPVRLDQQREFQVRAQEVRLAPITGLRAPEAVLAMVKVEAEVADEVVATRRQCAVQNLLRMIRNRKRKPSSLKARSLPCSLEPCSV